MCDFFIHELDANFKSSCSRLLSLECAAPCPVYGALTQRVCPAPRVIKNCVWTFAFPRRALPRVCLFELTDLHGYEMQVAAFCVWICTYLVAYFFFFSLCFSFTLMIMMKMIVNNIVKAINLF